MFIEDNFNAYLRYTAPFSNNRIFMSININAQHTSDFGPDGKVNSERENPYCNHFLNKDTTYEPVTATSSL